MAAASRDIIGREDELAGLERLLADPAPSASALVLDGEAGIGKTTVWLAGIELASSQGVRVLSCRPAETEAALPFVALGDLLEPVLGDVLPALPATQRAALETALLRSATPAPTDQLAISLAMVGVIQKLAHAAPLLVAVDDVQWLDPPTAHVLEFAVRRLDGLRVRLLVARRGERELPPPLGIGRALPVDRVELRQIGPLDPDELHEIVSRSLGVVVPRPTMLRIHEISMGNPFYGTELVRSLPVQDGRVETAGLALPPTLVELVRDRLCSLPVATLEIVAAAGALGDATLSTLRLYAHDSEKRLQAALAARIVRIQDGRVRFDHPLLASGSLAFLADEQRRAMHLRLAEIAPGLVERALHLALGSVEPSAETALVLEEASQRAVDQGAPLVAGELLEHSARLTPAGAHGEENRRWRLAAKRYVVAGEIDRGRRILERLSRELPPGPERAAVLLLLADTGANVATSLRLCEQARAEAAPDQACVSEATRIVSQLTMLSGRIPEALVLAREATRIAERLANPVALVSCLGTQAHFETYTGDITPRLLERAVALEQATPGTDAHYSPTQILGLRLLYSDRLDEARPLLERIAQQTEERGDELERSNLYLHLTQLEIRAGRWATAKRLADAGYDLDRRLGVRSDSQHFLRAFVAAHLGKVEDAREAGAQALAHHDQSAYPLWAMMTRWALGFLELSRGDVVAAAEQLAPLPDLLVGAGYRNPGVRPILPDAIEALVGVSRLEEAERWTNELAERGHELDNPWAIATAGRCAGLVSAARGDLETAREQVTSALEHHERSPNPFERARTLVVCGGLERRARRHGLARDALRRALEVFDALGAPLWSEKAAMELARVPGRRRHESGILTETEGRVAGLVVEGLSNKQVAAALFVSVRTVEASLTRIYRKLGVQSRAELTRRWSERM